MRSSEFSSADAVTLRRTLEGGTAVRLKFGNDEDLFVTIHAIGASLGKLFENSHGGINAACEAAVKSATKIRNMVACVDGNHVTDEARVRSKAGMLMADAAGLFTREHSNDNDARDSNLFLLSKPMRPILD